MTYVIAEPCVDIKDKACIEECPVDCIYEGARMLYIHPDECVDCGACEPVCPVEAIYYEDDVPDQWSSYAQANADFFSELGSPGGASKVGETDNDPQADQGPAGQGRGLSTLESGFETDVVRQRRSALLPEFPWDTLADVTALARSHPDGIVDLSVGTPVDPVAPVIRDALAAASSAPGYPTTAGTPALRASAEAALQRRYGITDLAPDAVLPVIGTKELIAWLPTLLAIGPGDTVVVPELAYPTYEVGALLAGAQVLRADSLTQLGPQRPALIYLNSPSNPTGRVLGVDHLRKVVSWARERGVLIASDECYLGLSWDAEPLSVLHPSVCDGDHTGLLAVHSLSKTSSLAGYRAGFRRRAILPWWPNCSRCASTPG